MSFTQWRASVDRVVDVRFRLRKPKSLIGEGHLISKAVMEQAEAELALLELQAEKGLTRQPLKFIAQSQVHVERGYGEARHVGLRGVETSEVR